MRQQDIHHSSSFMDDMYEVLLTSYKSKAQEKEESRNCASLPTDSANKLEAIYKIAGEQETALKKKKTVLFQLWLCCKLHLEREYLCPQSFI